MDNMDNDATTIMHRDTVDSASRDPPDAPALLRHGTPWHHRPPSALAPLQHGALRRRRITRVSSGEQSVCHYY
ncbi:hypothetical protein GUJ93_ZPchr0012g21644 [Zizania palustris]|uniref:Uncharacterized protein n=1 Tax=Zizania palustris TaxID=103762 RepID=A0A8J5WTL7_ZIZPA|nr:hypothetical protein GUJ93_ZPchr0012g21644 [Zizania palustris]